MNRKRLLIFIITSILLISCTPKRWIISGYTSETIAIDSATERLASKEMQKLITPYKQSLDKEMNVVIGVAITNLEASRRPESTLSNWSADIYQKLASDFLGEHVDMAIVNFGGLRAPIPKGEITVRNIFKLMPFENELVILWLKGAQIKELFDIFAKENGQGIAGASFRIKDKKAIDCKIAGKPIDANKLYSVATNDFLAAGNDRMIPFVSASKRINTELRLRDATIEYVKQQTTQGKAIGSQLDGRIVIADNK